MNYSSYKIPFPVKSLPSGGIVNPGVPNYNPDNYYVEFEGLSFGRMMEYEKSKIEAKNRLEKLAVEIDFLVPQSVLDFPVCDMYAIMTNVCILSGFDVVGDEKQKEIANAKGIPYESKPYYLDKLICPSCKKEYTKVAFGLHQISFYRLNNLLLDGKMKWKEYIQFDNNESDYIFKFEMPRIRDLRTAIDEFNSLVEYSSIEYSIALKLILLAISLELVEENKKKTFVERLNDIKIIFDMATGGDAMKLELLYNDMIIPPVLLKKVCNCQGSPSVYDITNIITDVLRLLIYNSRRVTQYIYEFPKELESGHLSDEFQVHNGNSFSLHKEIGKKVKRKEREVSEKEE